jgi:hypothetical protein
MRAVVAMIINDTIINEIVTYVGDDYCDSRNNKTVGIQDAYCSLESTTPVGNRFIRS